MCPCAEQAGGYTRPMPDSPLNTLLYFHTALANDLAGLCSTLADAATIDDALAGRVARFTEMAHLHTHVEEQGLFAFVKEAGAADTGEYLEEHKTEQALLASLGDARTSSTLSAS